jgi:type IV pilus assembly protein PilV
MRINLTEMPGFGTSTKYLFADTWADQYNTMPTAPSKLCGTESSAVACSASERADYDLYVWRVAARRALPQGSVQLAGNINLGMTATLMWFDKDYREGDPDDLGGTRLRTSPSCADVGSLSASDFSQATMRLQTCCPAAAAAPEGIRCANFTVVP